MQSHLSYGAATLALLVSVTCAFAQSPGMNPKRDAGSAMSAPTSAQTQAQISLTAQQKQAIWDSVGKGKGAKAPANFQASVGASVPAQVALRPLPTSVTQQMPDAKKYRYAKIEGQVLLIDPATHTVVDIIKQ
jgi:Spy/CpxP family protein refolding chaperone